MKKLLTVLTVLTIGLSSFASAGPEESFRYTSQKFNYNLTFDKIVVSDDIDLVIYENATTNIQFDGSKENIANVTWKVKKGVLYISSKTGSLKGKVIVTIDVAKLAEITLEGRSSVRSLGNLDTPELNVYIKDGCFAAIRNTGSINIINIDESEMNVIQKKGNVTVR
ncbi:MAG: DUF2807 domain-containing protein [Ferruginibacter sp.]